MKSLYIMRNSRVF